MRGIQPSTPPRHVHNTEVIQLHKNTILNHKLFSCEFLSSTTNDILVTLIYHKKLDDNWKELVVSFQNKMNIKIIGRSRKQKVILDIDTIDERLTINGEYFYFTYQEGGFTQPNQNVNIKMIEWVLDNIEAKYEDGVLKIFIPKKQKPAGKKIEIK